MSTTTTTTQGSLLCNNPVTDAHNLPSRPRRENIWLFEMSSSTMFGQLEAASAHTSRRSMAVSESHCTHSKSYSLLATRICSSSSDIVVVGWCRLLRRSSFVGRRSLVAALPVSWRVAPNNSGDEFDHSTPHLDETKAFVESAIPNPNPFHLAKEVPGTTKVTAWQPRSFRDQTSAAQKRKRICTPTTPHHVCDEFSVVVMSVTPRHVCKYACSPTNKHKERDQTMRRGHSQSSVLVTRHYSSLTLCANEQIRRGRRQRNEKLSPWSATPPRYSHHSCVVCVLVGAIDALSHHSTAPKSFCEPKQQRNTVKRSPK